MDFPQILWHFKGGQIRQGVVSRQGGDRDVDQKKFWPGGNFFAQGSDLEQSWSVTDQSLTDC